MINYDDPLIYEHLGVIIDAYERLAMKEKTRTGYMTAARAPLTAMLMMVQTQKDNLRRIDSLRKPRPQTPGLASEDPVYGVTKTSANSYSKDQKNGTTTYTTSTTDSVQNKGTFGFSSTALSSSSTGSYGIQKDPRNNNPQEAGLVGQLPTLDASVGFSVNAEAEAGFGRFSLDPDLDQLLKDKGSSSFLQECLGCDFRVKFDWQVKPVNLLGPLNGLLDGIDGSLDAFDRLTDPTALLNNICDALDMLSGLCLPDISAMLMAIKMAIAVKLNFSLNIRLDWTVLLGPIRLLITQAIMSLLEAIAGVLLAPLDCVEGVIASVDALIKEAGALGQAAVAAGKSLADSVGATAEGREEWASNFDVTGVRAAKKKSGVNQDGASSDAKKEFTIESGVLGDLKQKGKAAGTGVQGSVSNRPNLDEAMKLPGFFDSGIAGVLGPVLTTVRNEINDLLLKVRKALSALNGLVSGGLALDLSGLGTLVFLTDLVKMVVSLIQMLRQAANKPKNMKWCRYLDEHPELLVGSLSIPPRYAKVNGADVLLPSGVVDGVERKKTSLLLKIGPEVVGEVKTCGTVKSGIDSVLIEQWIAELEAMK